jgi:N-methylhydantoinase A
MADGILAIGTVIMAGAIRQVSVQHGLDPRDFVLFSYGGGGPLHSSALAHELAIPMIVIPPAPGNFSAVGMLLADARLDLANTFNATLGDDTVGQTEKIFAAMEKEAAASLAAEFGASDVFFERYAEMRYVGQRHNIKVPVGSLNDAAAVRVAFERDYKRRYGHADAKTGAEFQALHLSAFARQRRPDLAKLPDVATIGAVEGERLVYFSSVQKMVKAKVFDRYSLPVGFTAEGPAVLEEYGSTTIVDPRDSFEIGPLKEIRIHCGK